MDRADGWFMCRIGFVETVRAVGLSAGKAAAKTVREEWPAFGVIEVDQRLAEHERAVPRGRRLLHLGDPAQVGAQRHPFADTARRQDRLGNRD